MSVEANHARALLEEAQLALDRAHRAAIAADGGELRRGLDLAVAALGSAGSAGLGTEAEGEIGTVLATLQTARADLDSGALVEMEKLIETARGSLAKL